MAQRRAACWPSSIEYSRPTLPTNFTPSGVIGTWPERKSELAGDDEGHIVCRGLARNRQNDAKRLQSGFDFAGHRVTPCSG